MIKNKNRKIFLKNLNGDHKNNKNSHHSNREKGVGGGGESRTNYRTNQNVRIIINVFLGSQLSASLLSVSWVAHSSPAVRHCPQPTSTSLGGPPVLSGGGLWTCCGNSLDSNLALLLCVLASNVHSCQSYGVFCVCVCVSILIVLLHIP